MELTQLKQFKAIAEHNSLSLAAAELHISQPALSTMLKKLESELGTALFTRTRNRIVLNEAGELALTYVNQILDDTEKMEAALKDYAQRHSHVRLGFCDPGPMWYCIPRLFMISPQITHDCYSQASDEVSLLLNNRYDILISSEPLRHPDIVSIPFIQERIYLSVDSSHPLAGEKQLSLKNCPVSNLCLFVVKGAFYHRQEPLWEELKKHIPVTSTEDYFLFSQAVRNPDVVTITTRIVRHYRNDGTDRILIPLTDPEMKIHYHLSFLKSKRKELQNVLALLKQCAESV